jgi:LysM repeat protein
MKNVRSYAFIGVILLTGLCILAAGLYYFNARARAFNLKPLVLIHAPLNRDQVEVGDGVLVHATARENAGLRRIELWVDGQLIDARDSAEETVTILTLSSHWNPTEAGTHVLIVRAISSGGVDGQASVILQVSAGGQGQAQTHTVQEGETAEAIAAQHDVSLEELSASNPGLASAAPGDEVVIPDDDPLPAQGGDVFTESDPPAAEGDAPNSENPFFANLMFLLSVFTSPGERIGLRVEVLELRTGAEFDSLHCYVSLADSSPIWFPDSDGDQTTDESFALLADGRWDVEPYLEGNSAPIIAWPENIPLPMNFSCVGITGGGTDALELGMVALSIPPEEWESAHSIEVDGENGPLFLEYRVSREEIPSRGIPIFLDPSMTSPTNVRLDPDHNSLRWDYNPDITRNPPEEPIDGFRIYLNDTLQWVEPADARQSWLPSEWFHPQCGASYRFEVTAFRVGFPDGPESYPDSAEIFTPLDGCIRQIEVLFHSLETFDLGGDGDPGDRDLNGDVGPPYGHFFANEWRTSFHVFYPGLKGGVDQMRGLFNNRLYDLGEIFADPAWRFDDAPHTIVDIPLEGVLEIGFHIMDNDWKTDDLICEAISTHRNFSHFDRWQEDVLLLSEDGRCQLTFSYGPALGSPVGTGLEGAEPAPYIRVEEIRVDRQNDQVQVRLHNTGSAAWPSKDLDVELQTRSGETIAAQTWPDFSIEVAGERILRFMDVEITSPYDGCVLIDPDDEVHELSVHHPVCPVLPDLTITDVRVDLSVEIGTLEVLFQNVGEGRVWDYPLCIRVDALEGSLRQLELICVPNVNMEPGESRLYTLNMDADDRTRMRLGFYVFVNPWDELTSFYESDIVNNSYIIESLLSDD